MNTLGLNSEIVCDPTLLFYDDVDFYKRLSSNSKLSNDSRLKDKYILVYSLEHSDSIDNISNHLKEETGYPIVSLHPMNNQAQNRDIFLYDTDPYDFLYLIEHCSYIVTNSFHGLAFAYIFRKKVYCVDHSSLSSRQTELIRNSDFIFNKTSDNATVIDCDQNAASLNEYINTSIKKIENMING